MQVQEKKKIAAGLPPEGSLPWVECMLAQAEEGLFAAEHSMRKLYESLHALYQHRAWDVVFTDEPKTWERLLAERVDPHHRRVAWIEALLRGCRALRANGHKGRITRAMAETAAGYRDGAWIGIAALKFEHGMVRKPRRVGSAMTAAFVRTHAAVPVVPSTAQPTRAEVKAESNGFASTLAVTPQSSAPASATASAATSLTANASTSTASTANGENATQVEVLKALWQMASDADRERFAAWLGGPPTAGQ